VLESLDQLTVASSLGRKKQKIHCSTSLSLALAPAFFQLGTLREARPRPSGDYSERERNCAS
jgi:hypothetical protein